MTLTKQKDIKSIKIGDLIYDGVRYKKVIEVYKYSVLTLDSWENAYGTFFSNEFITKEELLDDYYTLIN